MLMKNLFGFILLITFSLPFSLSAYENEKVISPVRAPHESWQHAIERQMTMAQSRRVFSPRSALEVSEDEIQGTGPLPAWPSDLESLHDLAVSAYHARDYSNPNASGYQRRAPWFYPKDGCYAKAAHVSSFVSRQGFPKPGKVFVYGDLHMSSDYAKGGWVYWSYHVVAGYHIGSTVYVIDPLAETDRALTLNEWLSRMSSKPDTIRVALCDSNAYSPESVCIGGHGNGSYLGHIPDLLKVEYESLVNLGHNAHQILASDTLMQ